MLHFVADRLLRTALTVTIWKPLPYNDKVVRRLRGEPSIRIDEPANRFNSLVVTSEVNNGGVFRQQEYPSLKRHLVLHILRPIDGMAITAD